MFPAGYGTSTIAKGKVRLAHLKRQARARRCADSTRRAGRQTDPAVDVRDRWARFDNLRAAPKGFGLALLGDILADRSARAGPNLPRTAGAVTESSNNMMAILIDPDAFGMADNLRRRYGQICRLGQSSPTRAACVESCAVSLGDPERRCASGTADAMAYGPIPAHGAS